MKDSVVILGASRGIGQEIALHLANEGYEKLILVARNLDALKALEKSVHKIQPDVSVTSYGVDLTDGSACEKFFHQLEDDGEFPKHWIFSYGGSPTGQSNRIPIERREWSNVEDVMELNLLSQMRLTARILLELLRPPYESSLIYLGSQAGIHPIKHNAAYCAAKAGLHSFVKTLFEEHREDGVKCCLIAPGVVDTPLIPESPKFQREYFIDPDDVAKSVSFALEISQKSCPVEIQIRPQRSPFLS